MELAGPALSGKDLTQDIDAPLGLEGAQGLTTGGGEHRRLGPEKELDDRRNRRRGPHCGQAPESALGHGRVVRFGRGHHERDEVVLAKTLEESEGGPADLRVSVANVEGELHAKVLGHQVHDLQRPIPVLDEHFGEECLLEPLGRPASQLTQKPRGELAHAQIPLLLDDVDE